MLTIKIKCNHLFEVKQSFWLEIAHSKALNLFVFPEVCVVGVHLLL